LKFVDPLKNIPTKETGFQPKRYTIAAFVGAEYKLKKMRG
jgi:hypothetical protein